MKRKVFFVALFVEFIPISLFFLSCNEYKTNKLPDRTLEIVAYNGKETDVIIPDKIKGIKVTVIGVKSTDSKYIGAFQDKKLTSVTIPDTVTKIRFNAFANNQLTSVVIGNNVTVIEWGAFENNNLTSVTFPDKVREIGNKAFSGNQLTSIIVPDKVEEISDSAFANNQLTNVTIPNSVTSIGKSAFSGNQLTSVVIPEGVTYISDNTFANNQLSSVVIPNSVTEIWSNAFANNQLTSVNIPNSVRSIGESAFSNNQLKSVSIPRADVHIFGNSFDKDILINGSPLVSFRNIKFVGEGLGKDIGERDGRGVIQLFMDYNTNRQSVLSINKFGSIAFANAVFFGLQLSFNDEGHKKGTMAIARIQHLDKPYGSVEVSTKNGSIVFHRNDSITFEIKEGSVNNTMNITLGNGETYSLRENIIINYNTDPNIIKMNRSR